MSRMIYNERMSKLTTVVLVLAAMISIQSGAAIAKQIFPILGPIGTTTLRLTFASLILCALWRPWRMRPSRKEIRAISIYGASLGAMNLLFYLALARIPLGIAVALEFSGPLAVSLLASRKPVDFLWAALAATGISLILPITESSAPLDIAGVLLALAAGVCWALYILFGKRAGTHIHAGLVTSLGMVVATLVVLPIGLMDSGSSLLNPEILPLAIAVAIFSSALPYSLEMIAMKNLPAKNFGILMSIEPAIAALSGLIFMGELLTPQQWLAILCVILASFGSTLFSHPEKPTVPIDS